VNGEMRSGDRKLANKLARYLFGSVLAIGSVYYAGTIGRDFRSETVGRVIGSSLLCVAGLIMSVQAFTEEKYPDTRWVAIARVILVIGFGLYILTGR
jgi:hypothetical protein